jgi:hypothetical protein
MGSRQDNARQKTNNFKFKSIAALLLLATRAAGYGAVRQGLKGDPVSLLRAE